MAMQKQQVPSTLAYMMHHQNWIWIKATTHYKANSICDRKKSKWPNFLISLLHSIPLLMATTKNSLILHRKFPIGYLLMHNREGLLVHHSLAKMVRVLKSLSRLLMALSPSKIRLFLASIMRRLYQLGI